jgi:hypothetical protein
LSESNSYTILRSLEVDELFRPRVVTAIRVHPGTFGPFAFAQDSRTMMKRHNAAFQRNIQEFVE